MGGYFTSQRYLAPASGGSGLISQRFVNAGFPSAMPNADLRILQSTLSFRTGVPDSELDTNFELLNNGEELFAPRDSSGRLTYDTGHTFKTVKTWKDYSHRDISIDASPPGGPLYLAEGVIRLVNELPPAPVLPVLQDNTYGNRAIAQVSPTVPKANISVTAAEIIREGITAPGASYAPWLASRSSFLRSTGSEYLNANFGWLPLVSELQAVISSLLNAGKSIQQFDRDSGLIVRRSLSFPPIKSTTSVPGNQTRAELVGAAVINHSRWYDAGGNVDTTPTFKTTESSQTYWFKGAFTYYVSPGKNLLERLVRYEQLGNHLLGSRLTPEVLWELAPWSWLVDWFADIQTALRTAVLLENDGLVVKYGYLMRTTRMSNTTLGTRIRFKGRTAYNLTNSDNLLVKERARSTPFGFGLNPNTFTVRQWAILAALGLTKAPKTLF